MLSGSYTIDAIEAAGVDVTSLIERGKESMQNIPQYTNQRDPFWSFFNSYTSMSSVMLKKAIRAGKLETADILRSAIAPVRIEHKGFEFGDSASDEIIKVAMKARVLDAISSAYEHLSSNAKYPELEFSSRRHKLLEAERIEITKLYPWHVAASICETIDQWFMTRDFQITKDVQALLDEIEDQFSYGAKLFLSAGGSYGVLEKCIGMAQRYNPERDESPLVLCLRDGRVVAGQYTYRNSVLVNSPGINGFPIQRIGVQAIRPLPLIATDSLTAFEQLLYDENVTEHAIQAFLNRYPEILTSFGGYTSALPHIALTEPGKSELIPDYLLELPVGKHFHILDLKLPNANLVVGKRYKRISSELQSAVAQLRSYRKYFDNSENRRRFVRMYGLEPFRPEIVVVMGRTRQFESLDDRKEIEEQLGLVKLLTYDDLLSYGRSRSVKL